MLREYQQIWNYRKYGIIAKMGEKINISFLYGIIAKMVKNKIPPTRNYRENGQNKKESLLYGIIAKMVKKFHL